MKVLLRADVNGLGKRGDLVDVAPGHARNLLVPKGLAIPATGGMEAQAKAMRRSRDLRDAADRAAAEEIATSLVAKVIEVSAKAGAEGRLFGSVTAGDIVDAVRDQTGVVLDRRRLHMDEPIKDVGTHMVQAKLHTDVQFSVTVEVSAL